MIDIALIWAPRMAALVLRLCLLALFATIPLVGCSDSASESDGDAGDSTAAASDTTDSEDDKKPRRERAVTVNAAIVSRGELVLPVIAEGTIRARRSADVRSEISGGILRIRVDEGETVKAGQTIAELDPREYRVALDEARSSYVEALSRLAVEEGRLAPDGDEPPQLALEGLSEAATKDLEQAISKLEADERHERITRHERVRRQLDLELDALMKGAYREEIVAARSGVSEAWARLERTRFDIERVRITAPFPGVITEMTLTPGQQIQQNDVVCRLVDNVKIEANIGVLESDLRHVDVGRPVLLAIPALGDTLQATIDVISPEVNRDSRTCRVLVRFDNAAGRVRPGMFVRAIIAGQVLRDRLLVSRSAVLTRDNRPLVFKVDGDRAKWLYIEEGERNDQLRRGEERVSRAGRSPTETPSSSPII